MHDNYLRFISLRLQDYKVFGGLNDLRFNRHRTLIVGDRGTGKTTIVEALENLGPPKRDQKTLTLKDQPGSSLAIVTEGNRELIKKYRSLIFINRESDRNLAMYGQEPELEGMVPNSARKTVASKTRSIFKRILYHKPGKIDSHRDLNPQIMAAGERICFGYALVFAVREVLKLDIPVIFDSPYAMLDKELRKGMRDFLKTQPCQQILLGHECEFLKEERPKYILVYTENYSHVRKY